MSTPNAEESYQGNLEQHQSDTKNMLQSALSSLRETGSIGSRESLESQMSDPNTDLDEGMPGAKEAMEGLRAQQAGEEPKEEVDPDQQNQEPEEGSETNVEPEAVSEESEVETSVETVMADGRELTIDWEDKEPIRKAVQKAAAWASEKRDKDIALNHLNEEKVAHEATRGEIEGLTATLTQLEQAKELGPEAVIKLMFDRDLSSFQEEWAEREGWSDDKKNAFAEGLRVKQLESEMAGMKASAEASATKAAEDKAETVRQGIQNHFESSYRSHSLLDAFDDSDLGEELDDRLFEKVKATFSGKDSDSITAADIDNAFKTERARLIKVYEKAAATRVTSLVDKKKREAAAAVQTKATAKAIPTSAKIGFEEASQSNNGWKSILNNPKLRAQLSK